MKNFCFLLLSIFALANFGGRDQTPPERSTNFPLSKPSVNTDSRPPSADNSRSFALAYGATLTDLPANSNVRVWFPIAESNPQQSVELTHVSTPTEMQTNREAANQNQIGFFEITPAENGDVSFELNFDVVRHEASVDDANLALSEDQKRLFLSANLLVPLSGKPQELIKHSEIPAEPVAAGKILYEVVEQHMKYDKSNPGYGNGDAEWACDSRTGNCTDFHSLFISLARSKSLPARFEIGFPIPTDKTAGEIGGYHCWAWFHAEGKGWIPVDISEADKHPEMKEYYFGKLTADRVSFSNGRDIELVPKAAGGPLNYFVYPYVEVDGKPWPKEKIKLNFSFKNKQPLSP